MFLFLFILKSFFFFFAMLTIFFYDIIEQFDIFEFIETVKSNPFYIVEYFIMYSILFFIAFWFITNRKYGAYYFFSKVFFFILKANLKEKFTKTHFSVVCGYFFYGLAAFIFWQNITGMIPESLTITAFIKLPAHISFTFFIASFFIALEHTKFSLPRGFLPSEVPASIGPFSFVIEFLSYFIRLFSLATRLFVNLLAGHMLLKVFSIGLIVIFVNFTAALALAQMTINILTVILILIEYLACILQAIVLVSLVAIYIDHAQNFYHH